MKRLPLWAFVLLLVITGTSPYAQLMKWKTVAPFALQPARNTASASAEYGAIAAKGKIVLAGWKNVVLSTDAGLTWRSISTPMNSNDHVNDIAIYDDNTFAILASGTGAYLSNNQGLSWQNIQSDGGGTSIVFDGSPARLAMIVDQNIADVHGTEGLPFRAKQNSLILILYKARPSNTAG